MAISERAGRPADPSILVDVDRLLAAYFEAPDPSDPTQRVAFGTSGHRGSSLNGAFNEAHIAATTEAICRYRASQGTDGPLFIGKDPHALSEPAFETALRGLVAHGVDVRVDADDGYTPTPVISHAILVHNRGRGDGDRLADGIVVTPSHNPPEDGGFKYNPPNGGPADTDVTRWIQDEANRLLEAGLAGVQQVPLADARAAVTPHDYVSAYVDDLAAVIDMDAIRASGLRLGADPLGGASVAYWPRIGERYGLDLTVTNTTVDPQFAFMTCDWDGRIRMDPSSPYAMARLVELRDRFDVAFGNDTDADRHGIVTPSAGLLNPNHFLSAVGRAPVRWRARLGRGRGRRQDPGQLGDDRPGRRGPRPPPARGAGRVQVVRVGARRRQPRVRWRGECRFLVPAPRRHGLDDRQGRDHRLPPRGRDDRPDRARPRGRLRGADRTVRGARLPPHRRPGDARPEGRPRAPVAGPGGRHGPRRATR